MNGSQLDFLILISLYEKCPCCMDKYWKVGELIPKLCSSDNNWVTEEKFA